MVALALAEGVRLAEVVIVERVEEDVIVADELVLFKLLDDKIDELLDETTEELLDETTEELLDETTEELLDETTEELLDEMTEELLEDATDEVLELVDEAIEELEVTQPLSSFPPHTPELSTVPPTVDLR
jgi:hypothetical protein